MVANVSGNCLGLELIAQGVVGTRGNWGLPGQGRSGERVYVNASTGNLVVQRQDDYLAGPGADIEALRTYNSQGQAADDNGDNWFAGFYKVQVTLKSGQLNAVGSTLSRVSRDGSTAVYTYDDNAKCYVTTDGLGAYDKIVYDAPTQTFARTDGSTREVETYSGAGVLSSLTDAEGRKTSYTFTGDNLEVKDVASGESVCYDYEAGLLKQIRVKFYAKDNQGNLALTERTTVRYEYDTNTPKPRLSKVSIDLTPADNSVTDGNVYTTTYTYFGTGNRLKTLTQTDGSSLAFTYLLDGSTYRVATVSETTADGAPLSVTSYSYDSANNRTTVTDPLNKQWVYDYDAATGQLTKVTTPAIAGESVSQSYAYDASGNVTSITNGDGETITMTYDANGNQVTVTNALGQVVTRTFNGANQLLTETVSTAAAPQLIDQGGVSFTGVGGVVKDGGVDGVFDASVRSSNSISGGASVAFTVGEDKKTLRMGLTTTPNANHGVANIDFQLCLTADGNVEVREKNGANLLTQVVTYTKGDRFRVTYDGTNISYYKGSTQIFTKTAASGLVLFMDSSFCDRGASVQQLSFSQKSDSGGRPLVAEHNMLLATDGTASKNAGHAGQWDASLRSLVGYSQGARVSFKPTATNQAFMVGLTADPTASMGFESIDYAISCGADKTLSIYENGTKTVLKDGNGVALKYDTTDTFKVVYDYANNEMLYLRVDANNVESTLFKRTNVTIEDPLYLDSSFATANAKVAALQFGKAGYSDVLAAVKDNGLYVDGDTVSKTGAAYGLFDTSARSQVGYTGAAYLSFSAGQTDKEVFVGLNGDPAANASATSIDYAFYCKTGGVFEIRESGSNDAKATGSYTTTDKLEVVYDGSYVRYFKTDAAGTRKKVWETAVAGTKTLYVDSSFKVAGAKITNLRFADRADPELTSRYVYATTAGNSQRLRYAVSGEGRVTQFQYDATGRRIAEVHFTRNVFDLSGYKSNEVPTEAQLDAWVTGLGDLSQAATRKDFKYDARGLLTEQTQYLSVNADGSGVASSKTITSYIYDQTGRLLQSIQPANGSGDEAGVPATTYAYDGLGRLLSVQDPDGVLTTTTYSDAAQKIEVRYHSGATSTSTYDKAGRLLTLASSGGNSTVYAYDAAGQLLMKAEAAVVNGVPVHTGVRSFYFYDEAGRQIGVVESVGRDASDKAIGTLTETTYDKAGRISQVRTYNKSVLISAIYDEVNGVVLDKTLANIRPTAVSQDRQRWMMYDDAGRLVYEVAENGTLQDAETGENYESGSLTRHEYDGAGRLVRTVRHSVPIAIAGMSFASITRWLDDPKVLAGEVQDRQERWFYDADGLLTGTLDAEGYLTVRTYDQAGRNVQATRYATAVAQAQRGGGTLAALTPAVSEQDQTTVYFYDGRDQLKAEVDAEGYLTYNTYTDRGQLRSQTRYSTALPRAVSWTESFTTVIKLIRSGGVDALKAQDRRSWRYYDLDGQLRETVNFEGTRTFFEYDAARRLIKTTVGSNLPEDQQRQGLVKYDDWGRKIRELSGENAALITSGMSSDDIKKIWDDYGIDYAYDGSGRLISVTDAKDHKTLYYYGVHGQVTYTVNALGEVLERQYDAQGRLTGTVAYFTRVSTTNLTGGLDATVLKGRITIDSRDVETSLAYDGAGRLQYTTAADGAVTGSYYNVFGELDEQWVPYKGSDQFNVKRQDLYTYDRRGQRVKSVSDAATGGIQATVETEYDAFGRVVETLDANNHTWLTNYDKLGRVVTTTNPLSKKVTTAYDAFGQVLTVKDEIGQSSGLVTKYEYDRATRSVVMTTPEGVEVTTVHNEFGETYTVTVLVDSATGEKRTTSYEYYRDGQLKRSLVGTKVIEGREYDKAGLLSFTTDANGIRTRYTYDNVDRLLTRTTDPKDPDTNPDGLELKTQWAYDGLGRAWKVTDPSGTTTEFSFDEAGRTLTQTVDTGTGRLNLATSYTYDADGRVLTVTSPGQSVTKYVYDALGRRTSEVVDSGTDKLNLKRSYTYDNAGNVATATDARGYVTSYRYDEAGRLTYTLSPTDIDADGKMQYAVSYNQYDDAGRLVKRRDYLDTVTEGEDPSKAVANVNDRVTRYAYDDDGRLEYTVDGLGAVTKSEYNGAGQVTRVIRYRNPVGANDAPSSVADDNQGRDQLTRYFYDAMGRQEFVVDALGGTLRYEYDNAGRVLRRTEYAALTADGAKPARTAPNAATDRINTFRYDDAGRLTWSSDAIGGVTKNEYDKDGNVIRVTQFAKLVTAGTEPSAATVSADDRVTVMTYDGANRLQYTVDALNHVTLNTYYGDGQLKDTTRYLKLNTADLSGSGPFTVKVTADTANDRVDFYDYDGAGRVKLHRDAMGTEESFAYFATGQLKTHTEASNFSGLSTATEYAYDAAGNQTSKTVANGRVEARTTLSQYDALGQLVAETESRGVALTRDDTDWAQAERARLNLTLGLGLPVLAANLTDEQKSTLLAMYTSRHEYDANGRRTGTTNALGQKTSTKYDAFGNAVKVVDPNGNASLFYFDKLNRVTLQVDPELYANEITYANPFSSNVQTIWRYFNKVAASTNENKPPVITKDTDRDARLQYNQYDKIGRITSSATHLATGQETISYVTGDNNRFAQKTVTNKLGAVTTFNYDKLGQVKDETIVFENGRVDGQGQRLENTIINRYEYSVFGERTKSIEDAGVGGVGRTTNYRYDKLGRQTHRIGMAYTAYDVATDTTPTVIPVEFTAYDRLGRVIERRTGANLVDDVESGGARNLYYYDRAGNKIASIGPDKSMTNWVFDAAGRVFKEEQHANFLASMPSQPGGTPPTVADDLVNDRVTTSIYDQAGRLAETRLDGVVHWEQPDNSNGIVLNLGFTNPQTITLQKWVYDANGNVVQEIDGRGNSVYNYYDELGRKTLRIDQDGFATAWDFGDVFDVATKEVRYASRLPNYARQDDTSVDVSLRDPAKLREVLDDSSERPVDGLKGVRVAYDHKNLTDSSISHALGSFQVGDIVTFSVWFMADPQTMGQIAIRNGNTVLAESKVYGTGDWKKLTVTYKVTSAASLQIALYGDKDGAFHREGSCVTYDTATVTKQVGNTVTSIYSDSFESDAEFKNASGSHYWANANGLGSIQAVAKPIDRVTVFILDRLGRMIEKQIKGVAMQYVYVADPVNAPDVYTRVAKNADAITKFKYNNLGQISEIQERVGVKADDTDVWNFTNISYDDLGHEVKRQAPEFLNYQVGTVRPVTEIEYNGLGLVSREIQRGYDNNVETDDRITSYFYNSNGELTESRDAQNTSTRYEYDKMGRMAKRTVAGVHNADGDTADLVMAYQYDTAGRLTVTTDKSTKFLATGEVRMTRYNAFGQISEKRLGSASGNWTGQEFIYYNTRGKIEKNNTDGGVYKLYLYDRNGNATREITGGAIDLSGVNVMAAAANTQLQHSFSAYNKRNLLERTVRPDVKFQRTLLDYGSAFSQQLTGLYSGITADGGGVGTGDGNTDKYDTTVSSDGTSSHFAEGLPLALTGQRLYAAPGTASSVPASATYGFYLGFGDRDSHTYADYNTINLTIPASWPDSNYRLRRPSDNYCVVVAAKPGDVIKVPTSGVFNLEKAQGSTWILASQITTDKQGEPDSKGNYFYDYEWHSAEPRKLIVTNTDDNLALYACTRAGTGDERLVPLSALTDYLGRTVADYWTIDTSNLSDYPITLRYVDKVTGRVVMGDLITVTGTDGASCTKAPLARVDAWSSTKYKTAYDRGLYFNPDVLKGTGNGTMWVRQLGNKAVDWTAQTVTNWSVDVAAYGGADSRYEFIVDTGGIDPVTKAPIRYHGSWTTDIFNNTPVLDSGMLSRDQTPLTTDLTFDITPYVGNLTGFTGSFDFELTLNGKKLATKTATLVNGKWTVKYAESELGLTVNHWKANQEYAFSYLVFAKRPNETVRQFMGQDSGKVRLNSDPERGADDTVAGYKPQAVLNLSKQLQGSITVTCGSDTLTLPASGNWQRKDTQVGNTFRTELDFSKWFAWGATQDKVITVKYSDVSANFTATYALSGTGMVKLTKLEALLYEPKIPLTIDGATRMSVLKVGASGVDQSVMTAVSMSRVVTDLPTSTFTWDASDQAVGGHRFYYETVDASNKVVGKGYGKFTMGSNGQISGYELETPLLKPVRLNFEVPTGTTKFELNVTDSTGKKTTYRNTDSNSKITFKNGVFVFDGNGLIPPSGTATFTCDYVATDDPGHILSRSDLDDKNNLQISSAGAIVKAEFDPGAKPNLVKLYGPPGEDVPFMQMKWRDTDTPEAPWSSIFIPGHYDQVKKITDFTWTNELPEGLYDYEMTLLQAKDGQPDLENPYENALGNDIIVRGVMTMTPGSAGGAELQEYVEVLDAASQERHMQSYNAFGQISSEYDDSTYERMMDMMKLYPNSAGTADMDAVSTTFKYNTAGMLLSKKEAQTNATTEAGFQYRVTPTTDYGYDLLGRLSTINDPHDTLSVQTFAGGGERLAKQWDGAGGYKEFGYDVLGDQRQTRQKLALLPNGQTQYTTVNYLYDKLGHMTQAQRVGITRVEDFTDSSKVGTTITDRYGYDELGHRITHTNTYNWDNAKNGTATWTDATYYDGLDRVTKTVSAGGVFTAYTYEFIAKGASGGILGVGGKNLGGYKITTTQGDGRKTIDKVDYFGRTSWHQDMGGRQFTYWYDVGGRLYKQTGTADGIHAGQHIEYTYFANGAIAEARDSVRMTLSSFGYDNAGNRTWEAYSNMGSDGTAHDFTQNSTIHYDELNRLSYIVDPTYSIRYEYDINSNRRAVFATYIDPLSNGVLKSDAMWYKYDDANRFVLTKGQFHGERAKQIVWQEGDGYIELGDEGVELTYDLAGRRTSAKEMFDGKYVLEQYSYSTDGYLEDTKIDGALRTRRRVDALGRTLVYKEWGGVGELSNTTTSFYTRDNRLTSQTDDDATTTYLYYAAFTDDGNNGNDDQLSQATSSGPGALAQTTRVPKDHDQAEVRTTYSYEYWDNAKQRQVWAYASHDDVDGHWAPGFSDLFYDANGFLKESVNHGESGESDDIRQYYTTSANGLVMKRSEYKGVSGSGDHYDHFWYYAAGRRVGDVATDPDANKVRMSYAESLALTTTSGKFDNDKWKHFRPVTSTDFDQNYEPINATYPASTPDTYVVRTGDTLQSISQALWGDSAMWYLIAEANNLQGGEQLAQGQVLVIPNKVTNIHNNANTFRPYNPGEVIGNVDPTIPSPPQKERKCGLMTQIVQVVVTVVVFYFTKNAKLAAVAGNVAGQYFGAAVNGELDSADFWQGGITRLDDGRSMEYYLSHPPGFTGKQKFNYKSTAAAYAAAYVAEYFGGGSGGTTEGGGAGGAGGAAGDAAGGSAGVVAEGTASTSVSTSSSWGDWFYAGAKQVGASAAGTAAAQVIQGKWDWRGIASSAVGSAAGYASGSALGYAFKQDGQFGQYLAKSMLGGWASHQVSADDPRPASSWMGELFVQSLGGAMMDSIDRENRAAQARARSRSDGGASGRWGGMAPIDYSLASGGPVRLGTGSVEPQLTPEELQAAFRQSEREYRSTTDHSVEGRRVVVQDGDSVSGIGGSSRPEVVGGIMAANNMSSSTVRPGQTLFIPEDMYAYGDRSALGQSALDQDNRKLDLVAAEKITGLTRYTQDQRDADPNYRLASASNERIASAVYPEISYERQDHWLLRSYDNNLASWEAWKSQVRSDNDAVALSDRGGLLTAAVAFTEAPRELGFTIIDAGLSLGRGATSLYASADNGTLRSDLKDYYGNVERFGSGVVDADTYRLSLSLKDFKVMLGTDRVGVQYKTPGAIDEVGRFTYKWGDDNGWKMDTSLERNLPKVVILPPSASPVGVDYVPGVRETVSGSGVLTPSTNLDFSFKGSPVKFSVEMRSSGQK